MAQRVAAPNRALTTAMWILALASAALAVGTVVLVFWSPRALMIALACGLLALAAWGMFARVRATAQQGTRASSAVADVGLVLAGLAVAPLLAFAVLWASLLLILGAAWVLHALNLI